MISAGNMKYFQAKRESLKLGNANMCLCEAYFILSAQVQLGLINGLWKSMFLLWKVNLGLTPKPCKTCFLPAVSQPLCFQVGRSAEGRILTGVLTQPRHSSLLPPNASLHQRMCQTLGDKGCSPEHPDSQFNFALFTHRCLWLQGP